ncbi:MAG TPA: porin [Ramlibacter sp.]|nr:porin [Ramlibacter sp.]
MKKSLLLLSALGLATAACAQSSVTIFGVLDATVAVGRGTVADRTQLSRGGLTTPRIGFRGEEDLGGGMKAAFWLEAQPNVDDGSSVATNTNNQASGTGTATAGTQGLTFSRRSTVSLSSGWGELRMGRDLVPQYHNLSRGDVFGNVGAGAAINYTAIITGEVRVRASNMVSYFTPVIGGFAAQLSHYRGENASNAANSGDGTGSGLHLGYASGPVTLGLGYGRTKAIAGDIKQGNIHAGYRFGPATVLGALSRDEVGALTARGSELGVSAAVGSGEVKAGYSRYRLSTNETGKKLALGYVHNLSKRTALYVTAARISNSGGARYALNGATTAANASSTGYDIGLRHAF